MNDKTVNLIEGFGSHEIWLGVQIGTLGSSALQSANLILLYFTIH